MVLFNKNDETPVACDSSAFTHPLLPQVRKRKWENYSSGEELFGLPITLYPELEQTEKEIQMLDRLYNLYVTVITTIKGFGDYFWVDVVEKITEMGDTVNQYQNQSKKLPRALKEWPAYIDCAKTINDFLEMLPLFEVSEQCGYKKCGYKKAVVCIECT